MGAVRGKSTQIRPAVLTRERLLKDPTDPTDPCNVILYCDCDVMFVCKKIFLLTVSSGSGMTSVVHLANQYGKTFLAAFDSTIAKHSAEKWQISTIVLMENLRFVLSQRIWKSVELELTFPALVIAENKIRQVKDRRRSIIHSLPYRMPWYWVPELVKHVVQTGNLLISGTSRHDTSVSATSRRMLQLTYVLNLVNFCKLLIRRTTRGTTAWTRARVR